MEYYNNWVTFNSQLSKWYRKNKRELPWRNTVNPYHILVSEIMLQQTQVSRVLTKYSCFIEIFPDFHHLAKASLTEILQVWQGMGYNRRAKYLKEIAHIITSFYKGKVPQDYHLLMELPGIGLATACSIIVFIYNIPLVFIETNIRRVFIHHFFRDHRIVHDKEIMPFIVKEIDKRHPREWYYAVMDYGAYLAKTINNPNRKSIHYTRQSQFENSDRQIRGAILKSLLDKQALGLQEVIGLWEKKRAIKIIQDLIDEGFIKKEKRKYSIA